MDVEVMGCTRCMRCMRRSGCQYLEDGPWHAVLEIQPHAPVKITVASLDDVLPILAELMCRARMNSGVDLVEFKAIRAGVAPATSKATARSLSSASIGSDGSGFVLVPHSKPVYIPDRNVLSSCVGRFADFQWVVLSAFAALVAGIFAHTFRISWEQGTRGKVMFNYVPAVGLFVACATLCVALVLHRVNLRLFKYAMFTFDPFIIFLLVIRQWIALTWNNYYVLDAWHSLGHDLARLAIDILFCICIVACDAWNVSNCIKFLFLLCCLAWAIVKLLIGEFLIGSDGWFEQEMSLSIWLIRVSPQQHFRASWLSISVFILKAIHHYASGYNFAYCTGDLTLHTHFGKSKTKMLDSVRAIPSMLKFSSKTGAVPLENICHDRTARNVLGLQKQADVQRTEMPAHDLKEVRCTKLLRL